MSKTKKGPGKRAQDAAAAKAGGEAAIKSGVKKKNKKASPERKKQKALANIEAAPQSKVRTRSMSQKADTSAGPSPLQMAKMRWKEKKDQEAREQKATAGGKSGDDAILISDDDDDIVEKEAATTGRVLDAQSSNKRERPRKDKSSKKKRGKPAKVQAGSESNLQDSDDATTSAVETAFREKRAVLIGIHRTRDSRLTAACLGDAAFHDAAYATVTGTPSTNPAWITRSDRTGPKINDWFILCIFDSAKDAAKAAQELMGILKRHGQPKMVATLYAWRPIRGIANAIRAGMAEARAPVTGVQASTSENAADPAHTLNQVVTRIKGAIGWKSQPSFLDKHLTPSMLKTAFDANRAVIITIEHVLKEHEPLAVRLVECDVLRQYLHNAVSTAPSTQSAWVTETTGRKARSYAVFCLFDEPDEAVDAIAELEETLAMPHHGEIRMVVSDYANMRIVANNINHPAGTLAPREEIEDDNSKHEQAVRALDSHIQDIKDGKAPTIAPRPSKRKSVPDAEHEAMEGVTSTGIEDASTGPVTAKHLPHEVITIDEDVPSFTGGPKASAPLLGDAQSTKFVPAQKFVEIAQAQTSEMPQIMHNSTADDKENNVLNTASLSQMTYQEQVALQIRYLGEVEPGIPVHGCILCGQRDHLFESCQAQKCQHCGEDGKHISRACPTVKKCSKCYEKGHTIEQCPSKLKRTAEDGFRCDRCGEDGHDDADCSYVWRSIVPEGLAVKKAPYLSVSCYNCAAKDHWGADCPKPRETARTSHFDIFSAKEATKYLDASAPITNLLTESLNTCRRYANKSSGTSIKGASQNKSNYQADYRQQPVQQPRELYLSYSTTPPSSHKKPTPTQNSTSPIKVNLSLPPKPPASTNVGTEPKYNLWDLQQQPVSYGVPQAQEQYTVSSQTPWQDSAPWRQGYMPAVSSPFPNELDSQHHSYTPQGYSLTLPARPVPNRGNDGYVSYRANQQSNPPARSRNDFYDSYNDPRDTYYAGSRGGGGYGGQYVPPPPPDNEYGRRQTYHAVPPPPPPDNKRRRYH